MQVKFQKKQVLSLTLRLIAAIIMLQTLYYKFSGAEESIYIFSKLGIEPWGRIGIGIAELIASILLLIPFTILLGAALTIGLMVGAIFAHITKLGIIVQNDNALLFVYACIVLLCAITITILHKENLKLIVQKLKN